MQNLTRNEAGILSKAKKIEIVNNDPTAAHYLLINDSNKNNLVLKNLDNYPLPKVCTTLDFKNQMKYTLITLIINGEI
tara:strand:+ start:4081 stop:4314 length:234 start_codon:yes stop_codon:yes gene_type:complete